MPTFDNLAAAYPLRLVACDVQRSCLVSAWGKSARETSNGYNLNWQLASVSTCNRQS